MGNIDLQKDYDRLLDAFKNRKKGGYYYFENLKKELTARYNLELSNLSDEDVLKKVYYRMCDKE